MNIVVVGCLVGLLSTVWLESPLQQRPISLVSSSALLLISSVIQLLVCFVSPEIIPNHSLYVSLSLLLMLHDLQSAKRGTSVDPVDVINGMDDSSSKEANQKEGQLFTGMGPYGYLLLLLSSLGFLFKLLWWPYRSYIDAGEVILYFVGHNIASYSVLIENDYLSWAAAPQIVRMILFGNGSGDRHCSVAIRALDITTWAMLMAGTLLSIKVFKHTFANIQQRRVYKIRNQLHEVFDKVTSMESRLRSQPIGDSARRETYDGQIANVIASFNRQLRNVLHAVINCVSLLAPTGDPVGTNQARQREYVRNLDVSVRLLAALVENTIKLLKARVGDVVLDRTRAFRVEELFDSVIDGCSQVENNHDIDIICDIDADVPKMIIGDHNVVKELLAHLFDNAVRYTQKGEVRLTARVVERFGDLIRLAISVEDTGPGIDAKILPSLSVPFKYGALNAGRSDMFDNEAAESNNTDPVSILDRKSHGTSGSGLGIPIATNLARLFPDGDLVISSEPNSGTACTFTALFSYQKHSSVTATLLKTSVPTLCVCGPTFQAEALPNLLRRDGFESVHAVSSSEEALEYLQKADPPVQLVILYDWTRLYRGAFSRLKGSEVAEKIRATKLKLQPKLCLVSSNSENRSQNDAFVAKPIRIRAIRQVVSRMFGDAFVPSEDTRGPRLNDRSKGSLGQSGDTRAEPNVKDEELDKVKLRILVAEDDRVNARVISASVRKLGHECHITGDGKTCALEFSKDPSKPYDIVFMDLYMPGMNGIDATKQIREYETRMGLSPTIIIGVTAEDRHAEQSQMLNAGMDDIILKPVTVTGLRGFLRRAQAKKYRSISGSSAPKSILDASSAEEPQSSASVSGRSSVSSSSSDDSGVVEAPVFRTRKTVLVAEDNDFTAKMTLQVLKSNGWECDRAKNGRDAFEMVTSNYEKYCMILMDIQMPLVDGLACTKQIREWERTHGISPAMKILALTGGDDDPQRRNECKSAGCDEFFTKPINYPKLVPQLQSLLTI
eukprot:TRINITY_DN5672_c0_g1_i1.p1 TRINITY_DN5672_c0_g1~~TRINITY_DN5672_c0_g1_i1.p1  ORF type:complete len:1009 (+),score=156.25 TRINITY_DN5672_c0_g1_i1:2367-5393(+)